ncbi:MAG TPA: NAD-dependent epimerase/dehydratase family protein [Thermoanaerobaculia bacterium]|nr:NAD-dependent epimerase/dehydratase family protein [Thermoanaerobaculia bacterium]
MSRRYLVTGGTGFMGSALVKRLLTEGHGVRVLDNGSRGKAGRLREVIQDVEFVEGDIRDLDIVVRSTKNIDSICHLAYVNGTEFFYSRPELVLDVAVRGMSNVLAAGIKSGVGEIILASSSEVYQTPAIIPTPEDVPLSVPDLMNPRYSYGGGKIISELMAINFGRKHFERVVIFRPHNVYGPDMGSEHVIPQLALRIAGLLSQGNSPVPLRIQGTGQETRAFVYIDDLVDGLMRVIEQAPHLSIYNIGTDQEVSIARLAHEIAAVAGIEIELQPGELQPGSTLRRCPDISKLRALGYTPRVSLQSGLRPTVEWYLDSTRTAPG